MKTEATPFAQGQVPTTQLRYIGNASAEWDPAQSFGVSTFATSIMNETIDLRSANAASAAKVAEARAAILQLVPTEDQHLYPSHGVVVSAASTFRVADSVYGPETAGLRTGGATARLLWPRGGRFWTRESPVEGFMDLCGRLLVTYNRFILPHGRFNADTADQPYKPFVKVSGSVGELMALFVARGFADVAFSFGRLPRRRPPLEDDPPVRPRFTWKDVKTGPGTTIDALVLDEVDRGTARPWVYRGLAAGTDIYLSRQMVVDMAVVCDELLYQALRVRLSAPTMGWHGWVYARRLRQLALAPALYVAKVWLHEAIHTRFSTHHPQDGCVEELASFRWAAMVSSVLGVPSCDTLKQKIVLDSGFSEYLGTASTCADDDEQTYSSNGSVKMRVGRWNSKDPAYGDEPRITRVYLAVPGVALAEL